MVVEQELLFKKLYYILHRSLVDARNAALAKDHAKVYDLADAFEILPGFMAQWEDGHLDLIRDILARYQAKYGAAAFDYLSILDMDEGHFLDVYGRGY